MTGVGPTTDDVYRLLSDEERRYILAVLAGLELPLLVSCLVSNVARRRAGVPEGEDVPEEELERVRISCYHNHLPKLDGAGVVEFDREQGSVQAGPHFDRVLEMAPEGLIPVSS